MCSPFFVEMPSSVTSETSSATSVGLTFLLRSTKSGRNSMREKRILLQPSSYFGISFLHMSGSFPN